MHFWLFMGGEVVWAADLGTVNGFAIRWDNTIGYSAGFRITPRNGLLLDRVNSDDGDRNFAPGLVSNRVDLKSEFDISAANFGAHISAWAWYDTVYHARTDNNSPSTYNPLSVPSTQFTRAARNIQGQHAEIADAFIYGNFEPGGVAVSLRAGRQTLLWGESLFFDPDSIAAAQAPADYLRNMESPDDYSRNVFLPVGQIVATVQPSPDLAFAFYYQPEWRATRLPAAGSYFSYSDVIGAGNERLLLSGSRYLLHGEDHTPAGDGQLGASLHLSSGDFEFGLYAIRFNAKYPTLGIALGAQGASDAGEFELLYPEGIELYGASFSTYLGASSIAGEVSARRHMPLVTTLPSALRTAAASGDTFYDTYAEGDTLHLLLSSITTLSRAPQWDSADLSLQVSAGYLLGVNKERAAPDPSRTRFDMDVRALFEPHYFEVLPNLDLTVPLGLGFRTAGRSSTDYLGNAGAGDFEAGLVATYRSVWKASLTLTVFLGSARNQPLTDRDFVAFRIERSF